MNTPQDGGLGRIHQQLMWDRLISVVEEQAQALIRTAFGTATREAGDLSAGVFLPDGRMIAQAVTGTPGHVNTMARSVPHFLAAFPLDGMREGDVFITNDPWKGTGHLNDLTMVTPVFRAGAVVALFASTVHLVDIGGLGLSADGTQIYHEGLYLPPVRLVAQGNIDKTLLQVIHANVREPVQAEGDLFALIACNAVGGRRLLAMMQEYAITDVQALGEHIIAHSRQAMLDSIAEWPRGTWRSAMVIDGYDTPIHLAATLSIGEDGVDIDFSGTSGCVVNGINVPMSYTEAYSSFGVRCIIGSHVPNNNGSLDLVRVSAPNDCIVNAQHPRAVSARAIVGQMLPDVIFGCLRQARPELVPAEGTSALWTIRLSGAQVIAGIDPADIAGATRFNITGFNTGGTGARPGKDGLSTTSFPSGVRNVSIEVLETLAPVVYWRKEYRVDSGGAGEFRGGLGQVIEIGNAEDAPMVISATFDRIKHPARGCLGGHDGAAGRVSLRSGALLKGMGRQVIPRGDRVIVETPGGAGLGAPSRRQPERLQADVRAGYVSAAQAALYGGGDQAPAGQPPRSTVSSTH